jgi:hypothetical protein
LLGGGTLAPEGVHHFELALGQLFGFGSCHNHVFAGQRLILETKFGFLDYADGSARPVQSQAGQIREARSVSERNKW